MANINFIPDKLTHQIEDGSKLIEVCDEINVSLTFGCTEGSCGICELTVLNGKNNLSKITDEEKNYLLPEDLDEGMRLGCQLKVRKGDVSLTWKKVKKS
jgi:ferredoxin, 2Fe-2S